MRSVLDRLGGFGQQSSVYNVLGRAFRVVLPGEPLARFCPLLAAWAGYLRRVRYRGDNCTPRELSETTAEVKCSELGWKLSAGGTDNHSVRAKPGPGCLVVPGTKHGLRCWCTGSVSDPTARRAKMVLETGEESKEQGLCWWSLAVGSEPPAPGEMSTGQTRCSTSLRLSDVCWLAVLQRLSRGHGAGCRKHARAFLRTSSAALPPLCTGLQEP